MASRKSGKGRHKANRLPRRLFKRPPGPRRPSDALLSKVPPGARLVYSPAGHEKMSDVLREFVDPYWNSAPDESALRGLLSLAIVAWNAALLPDDEGEEMVDEMIATGFPRASAAERAEARGLLESLVARKREHFAANRRAIVSFELMDEGHEYRIHVMSTLPSDGLKPEDFP